MSAFYLLYIVEPRTCLEAKAEANDLTFLQEQGRDTTRT